MSVVVEAQYGGTCFSCVFGIRPGQRIRLNETVDASYGGEWEHVVCPPAPVVCGDCFTEIARNGACLCEVAR